MLAGLGGLDGSVDREDVGLGREIFDRGNDLADGLALLAEADHGVWAMEPIWRRMRSMPAAASSVDFIPPWEICIYFF